MLSFSQSKRPLCRLLLATAAMLLVSGVAHGQEPTFTFQGELLVEGFVFNGQLDAQFQLFDAEFQGTALSGTLSHPALSVAEGLFGVELDFGLAFDDQPSWLEVRIRETGSGGTFETLYPRQLLGRTPGARFAFETWNADTVDGRDASDLEIQSLALNGTVLELTEGSVTLSQNLAGTIADQDMDPANELNTNLSFDGTDLDVVDPGGTLSVDLSSLRDGVDDADNDPTNELITAVTLSSNLLQLIEGGTVTNLADLTALLNSAVELDGTDLRLTDGGGTLTADLSTLVDDADADPANEANTGFSFDGSDLTLTDAGGTLTADLTTLPIEDADANPANELINLTALTNVSGNANGDLLIVEAGITNLIDVTPLQNAALAFDGTSLDVTDGGGTLSADLSSLGADADADPTNELNTSFDFDGDLFLDDAGGTLVGDLSALPLEDADADPTNELIDLATLTNISGNANGDVLIVEAGITNLIDVTPLHNASLDFDGTSLSVNDGGGTLSTDLSALANDADSDPANELNSSLILNSNSVEVTDAGGTLSVDLTPIQDGTADADADPANELITRLALTNNNDALEILEGGVTNLIDVTPLHNASFTFDGADLDLTDGGGTLSATLSALGDDADADPTNERNSALGFDGTDLDLTDAGGTLSVDLSGLADGTTDADADPANELITQILLTGSSLEITDPGGTNVVDVSALENSAIALSGTSLQVTDGGGTVSVDLAALENRNTAMTLTNTVLQITDNDGTLSQDLASIDGINDSDTSAANELITGATLDGANTLEVTEGANSVSVDLTTVANSGTADALVYDNFGWIGTSAADGTGASSGVDQKLLELVAAADSNRFEVDFERIHPGNIITNLPFTISQPGNYYVIGNLSNTVVNGDGITIDANDVTLDLMGYTLYGGKKTGINSDDGIFILGSQTNIKIRNGGVVAWNGDGINALNADFSTYVDVHVRSNDGDGLVGDFNNLMVRVTAYSNGLDGIEGDDGTVIFHCTAGQNGDNGIQVSEGSAVINSASFDNRVDGFDVAAGGVVNGCTATDNGVFGFDMALGSEVLTSTAYDNISNGFDMSSACILRDSISSLNNGHGVRTFANTYITDSKFHENDLDGIRVSSTDGHIQGNQVTDNDQVGIQATSSGSFIIQNTAAGNLTNYNINANCAFGPILDVTSAGDLSGVAGADHPWANFEF